MMSSTTSNIDTGTIGTATDAVAIAPSEATSHRSSPAPFDEIEDEERDSTTLEEEKETIPLAAFDSSSPPPPPTTTTLPSTEPLSTTTTEPAIGYGQQGVEVLPQSELSTLSLVTPPSPPPPPPPPPPQGEETTTTTKSFTQPEQQQTQEEEEQKKEQLLRQAELDLRHKVATGGCCGSSNLGLLLTRFFINNYSAVLVFAKHLISLESLLSIALSVSMTIYAYNETKDNDTFDGSIMNWVLLTFAVVTPMSASIGMAFRRREEALGYVAVLKATLLNLYGAHSTWDWPKADSPDTTGRVACSVDWMDHSDQALRAMWHLVQEMTRFLTLPNASRARHRVTVSGRQQAADIAKVATPLYRSAIVRVAELTLLCEVLKRNGLPPNEAIRIRQWERFVSEQLEKLRTVKQYRTPQALRSFARLFSVFLPPFYAPFYGQMATDLNSLAIAIAFSVVTSVALTSLFESIYQMEDPFIGIIALDGIDVQQELEEEFHQELLDRRHIFFPNETQPFVPAQDGGGIQDGNSNVDDDDVPKAHMDEVRLWQADI